MPLLIEYKQSHLAELSIMYIVFMSVLGLSLQTMSKQSG